MMETVMYPIRAGKVRIRMVDQLRKIDWSHWAPAIVMATIALIGYLSGGFHFGYDAGRAAATQEATTQTILGKITDLQSSVSDLQSKVNVVTTQLVAVPDITRRVGALEAAKSALQQQLAQFAAEMAAQQQALADLNAASRSLPSQSARVRQR
jgi:hypothetical protein